MANEKLSEASQKNLGYQVLHLDSYRDYRGHCPWPELKQGFDV